MVKHQDGLPGRALENHGGRTGIEMNPGQLLRQSSQLGKYLFHSLTLRGLSVVAG